MSTVEEITLLITAKAEEIRLLKAAKATKEEITPVVADLLALKERLDDLYRALSYALLSPFPPWSYYCLPLRLLSM